MAIPLGIFHLRDLHAQSVNIATLSEGLGYEEMGGLCVYICVS